MAKRCWVLAVVVLTLIPTTSPLFAVPGLMNYQGKLTDSAGNALDGFYLMSFYLYDYTQSDVTPVWSDESLSLEVNDGIYNVELGITPDLCTSDELYLEVAIFRQGKGWETLVPRQRFTSTAYSMKAADAETVDGVDSAELDQLGHLTDTGNPHSVTTEQIGAASSSNLSSHEAKISAHHSKTTSFTELMDQATDAQIPNDITINKATNADTVDGKHASAFATAGHNHDSRYYTQAQVDSLVSGLQSRIAQLENLLAAFSVSVDGKNIYITSANLHIRSGSGGTDGTINGLGNLIVGYDEARPSGSNKTGSHNIVVGRYHNYSFYGGLVAGASNTISAKYASVGGGTGNTASNSYASVSGGGANTASGIASSVCGGTLNQATNEYATVSGGETNAAKGRRASVSGGRYNTASGDYASIAGGGGGAATDGNRAFGHYTAILGGRENIAGDKSLTNHSIGVQSAVSGGAGNRATGTSASVSGGYINEASGSHASISGGRYSEASGSYASVGGGRANIASGTESSVSGGEENSASGVRASVSGGWQNTASGIDASVTGGQLNSATHGYSSVTGGRENQAMEFWSSISGGYQRAVDHQFDWRGGHLWSEQ
jgi:hypothetical protein